ncbi:nucleoside hydrolase [Desulfoluna sp.]|uniref:nucleoside hydrolase n=1 Tax=Desulfoluna sp. TaxID=2045199 RepID=UPI0026389DD3|nr:nucleoside hydrolase [Desulfoluna sp.]
MKKKVIIDTDMGWDDILSILYLIKHPGIDILGITVTGCGETDLRWGLVIAQTLMELGHQTQARICAGAPSPLKFTHRFPQPFKNEMNDIMGLLGTLNPPLSLPVDERSAWEFMAQTLDETHDKITFLSLGGFTNIARLLEISPSPRIENISEIVAMAGAVYVDGNVALLNNARTEWDQGPIYSTNTAAEWNVFVDPLAAKCICDSEIPLTLVPLDACNHVMLSPDYATALTATDPLATLAKNIFQKKSGSHNEGIPVPIFDPLATLIMAGEMPGYHAIQTYLDVDLRESSTDNPCGKTRVADSGSREITVVHGVSQRQFADGFTQIMNRCIPKERPPEAR